jgi:hypothetical protein
MLDLIAIGLTSQKGAFYFRSSYEAPVVTVQNSSFKYGNLGERGIINSEDDGNTNTKFYLRVLSCEFLHHYIPNGRSTVTSFQPRNLVTDCYFENCTNGPNDAYRGSFIRFAKANNVETWYTMERCIFNNGNRGTDQLSSDAIYMTIKNNPGNAMLITIRDCELRWDYQGSSTRCPFYFENLGTVVMERVRVYFTVSNANAASLIGGTVSSMTLMDCHLESFGNNWNKRVAINVNVQTSYQVTGCAFKHVQNGIGIVTAITVTVSQCVFTDFEQYAISATVGLALNVKNCVFQEDPARTFQRRVFICRVRELG